MICFSRKHIIRNLEIDLVPDEVSFSLIVLIGPLMIASQSLKYLTGLIQEVRNSCQLLQDRTL